jgi:excisionase family DNA binding protein
MQGKTVRLEAMNMPAQLHKVPEVAEMLDLSEKTIWQWIGQRRVAVVRLGRSVRISRAEIERLISDGTTPARLTRV